MEGIFPVVEEPEELEEDIITEESEEVAVEDDIPTEEIATELTEVPVQLEKSEDKPKAVAKPRAVAKPKVVAKPKAIKKVDAE